MEYKFNKFLNRWRIKIFRGIILAFLSLLSNKNMDYLKLKIKFILLSSMLMFAPVTHSLPVISHWDTVDRLLANLYSNRIKPLFPSKVFFSRKGLFSNKSLFIGMVVISCFFGKKWWDKRYLAQEKLAEKRRVRINKAYQKKLKACCQAQEQELNDYFEDYEKKLDTEMNYYEQKLATNNKHYENELANNNKQLEKDLTNFSKYYKQELDTKNTQIKQELATGNAEIKQKLVNENNLYKQELDYEYNCKKEKLSTEYQKEREYWKEKKQKKIIENIDQEKLAENAGYIFKIIDQVDDLSRIPNDIFSNMNISLQTDKGFTVLALITRCCSPKKLLYVFQNARNINETINKQNYEDNSYLYLKFIGNTSRGNTPLHVAHECKNYEQFILLLEGGANYTIKNTFKKTCIENKFYFTRPTFSDPLMLLWGWLCRYIDAVGYPDNIPYVHAVKYYAARRIEDKIERNKQLKKLIETKFDIIKQIYRGIAEKCNHVDTIKLLELSG